MMLGKAWVAKMKLCFSPKASVVTLESDSAPNTNTDASLEMFNIATNPCPTQSKIPPTHPTFSPRTAKMNCKLRPEATIRQSIFLRSELNSQAMPNRKATPKAPRKRARLQFIERP